MRIRAFFPAMRISSYIDVCEMLGMCRVNQMPAPDVSKHSGIAILE